MRKIILLTFFVFWIGFVFSQDCSNNLLQNPGFELGPAGWDPDPNEFIGISTTNYHSGTKAGYLEAEKEFRSQIATGVTPGHDYKVTFWADYADATYGKVTLKFFGPGYNNVLAEEEAELSGIGWKEYTITAKAPAGTEKIEFGIYKHTAPGRFYIDDVCLVDMTDGSGAIQQAPHVDGHFSSPNDVMLPADVQCIESSGSFVIDTEPWYSVSRGRIRVKEWARFGGPGYPEVHVVPGPYPAEFNSSVTINIKEIIVCDGYGTRAATGGPQSGERVKIQFYKDGVLQGESLATEDLADGVEMAQWIGSLGTVDLPNGTDEIRIYNYGNSMQIAGICMGYAPFSSSCPEYIPAGVETNALTSAQVSMQVDPVGGANPGIVNSITVQGEPNPFTYLYMPDGASYSINNPDINLKVVDGTIDVGYYGTAGFTVALINANSDRDLDHYAQWDDYVTSGDYVNFTYSIPIKSAKNRYVVVTERNGNNPYKINALDQDGNIIGDTKNVNPSDYIGTGFYTSNYNQEVKYAVYPLTAFVSTPGTEIYGIRLTQTGNGDGGDGKIFILADPFTLHSPPAIDGEMTINSTCLDGGSISFNTKGVIGEIIESSLDNVDFNNVNSYSDLVPGDYTLTLRYRDHTNCFSNYAFTILEPDCPDSDGDNIPDYKDLDDDNDGILDKDEMHCAEETFPGGKPEIESSSVPNIENIIDDDNITSVELSDYADYIILRFPEVFSAGAVVKIKGFGNSAYDNAVIYVSENRTKPNQVGDSEWQDIDFGTEGSKIVSVPLIRDAKYILIKKQTDDTKTLKLYDIAYESRTENVCNDIDTDNDGIVDRLDLDSDADGCPDAIEGDENVKQENLVISDMPGGSTNVQDNLGNTVGATPDVDLGVPIIVNAGGSADEGSDVGQGAGGSKNKLEYTITEHPQNQEACEDNDAQFTAKATSTPAKTLNYQWQVSTDGGNTWTNVAQAGASGTVDSGAQVILELQNITASVNNNQYRVVYTHTDNTCSIETNAGTLTIKATSSAPTGDASQSFCSASNPTVASLVATGTDIKWYDAATSGNLLAANTALVDGTIYYASQTEGGKCESQTRLAVTAKVTQTPATPTATVTQPDCGVAKGKIEIAAQTGNVEYKITGRAYQDSNVFEDVDGGKYTLYVRNKDNNDCESQSEVDAITINSCANIVVEDAGTVIEGENVYLEYDVKVSDVIANDVEATLSIDPTSTAIEGEDFTAGYEYFENGSWVSVPVSGKITLPKDGTAVKVRVKVIDDILKENDETVVLKGTTTDTQIIIKTDTGVGTIKDETVETDKDAVYAEISVDKLSTPEGTQLKYTVNLVDKDGNPVTVPAGKSVAVNLVWSGEVDVTATYLDTSDLPSSITIAGGTSQTVFNVDAETDAIVEGDETIIATINSVTDTDDVFEKLEKSPDVTKIVANSKITDNTTLEASVGDATAIEGDDLVFDASLSGTSVTDTPVTVKLTDGTADLSEDTKLDEVSVSYDGGTTYQTVPVAADGTFTATVPAGKKDFKIKVPTKDDIFKEGDETITISVKTATQAVADTGVGTIKDETVETDKDKVFVKIAVDQTTVDEGGDIDYTVSLVDKDGNAVKVPQGKSVDVALVWTGDAVAADFEAVLPTTITIEAGKSEKKFTVATKDDDLNENDETVIPTIDGVTDTNGSFEKLEPHTIANGAVSDAITVTTKILDNEGKPTVTVGDAEAFEGDDLVHSVTLSNPSASEEVYSFNLGAGDTNPATPGMDFENTPTFSGGVTYDAVTGKIKVPAGVTSFTVTYPTIDDAFSDNNETTKLTIGGNDGVGTIKDETNEADKDVVYAKISVDKTSVSEGSNITYTVSLVDKAGKAVVVPAGKNVDVSLVWTGDAVAADFTGTLPASVTVAGGTSKTNFTVTTKDDGLDENDETVIPTINGVTDTNNSFEKFKPHTVAEGAPSDAITVTTTILDGSDAPKFAIEATDAEATEGVAGDVLVFEVSQSAKSAKTTKVKVTLDLNEVEIADIEDVIILKKADGTEETLTVAQLQAGVEVEIPANADVATARPTFAITPKNDSLLEGDEVLKLKISDAENATIDTAKDEALGTIKENTTLAVDDINNTFQGSPVSGNVLTNDIDLEGNTQTVNTTPVTEPTNGSITINTDGTYTYTPNSDFIGTDTFEYEVCDDGTPQACDKATVTIEVLPRKKVGKNTPPVANNDTNITKKGVPVDGTLLSNDFDPDKDNITIKTTPEKNPDNGTVVINSDGTYTYTPNPDFVGTDTFEYEICDDGTPVMCDKAVVTIEVLPEATENITVVNDDAYNGEIDEDITGNVLDNDQDPEGNTQIIETTPLVSPVNGSVVINSDGTFTYTPDAGYYGTDSFVYAVCDDGTPIACDKATVYLTVNGEAQDSKIALVKTGVYQGDASVAKVGDIIKYTFTVTNIGSLTVKDINITDGKLLVAIPMIAELLPGETKSVTADYAVIQADIEAGKVVNTAEAIGKDPQGKEVKDTSGTAINNDTPTEVPIESKGSIALIKVGEYQGDASAAKVGDIIKYTFTVTNTGNLPITNIEITDAKLLVTIPSIAELLPGEAESVTADYVVTQADIDAGKVVNSAVATGQDPNGKDVTDTSGTAIDNDTPTEVLFESKGSIALVKTGEYQGNAGAAKEGDIIRYTFAVTNTGSVTVKNIKIMDAKLAVAIPIIAELLPGKTKSVTADYVITQADIDAGKVVNSAVATGQDRNGKDVTDTSGTETNNDTPTEVTIESKGSIALVKVGEYQGDANAAKVGDIIKYSFVVTNTGNVTVTNINITDAKLTVSVSSIAKLLPGETKSVTADYTVTQSDIEAGKVVNSAVATGQDPKGKDVTDTSGTAMDNDTPIVVELPGEPKISLIKTGLFNDENEDSFAQVGETITYVFTFKNIGNVKVKDLKLTDAKLNFTAVNIAPSELLPSEVATYTATYTLTQDDVDAGVVTNTALAAGTTANGDAVADVSGTDESNDTPTEVEAPQHPSMSLDKTGVAPEEVVAGGVVEYTFVIHNTGNVVLHDVTVTDAKIVAVSPKSVANLAVGASATFRGSYELTQADVDAGVVTNTAEARGRTPNGKEVTDISDNGTPEKDEDGDGDPGNDITHITLAKSPKILISKISDRDEVRELGESITYLISVENTGNVTLYNVVVEDPLTGFTQVISELAVGGVEEFITSYEVTMEAIANSKKIVNVVSVVGETLQGEEVKGVAEKTVLFVCPDFLDLFIPQVITPNNDGFNDKWEVPELKLCDVCNTYNNIIIFNRWGAKVYEKKNYMLDAERFEGYSDNSLDFQGNVKLPAGVYFYVIELDGIDSKTGHFYILEE